MSATGVVSVLELVATAPKFGEACRQVLEESIWRPARRSGANVSSEGYFDCNFGGDPFLTSDELVEVTFPSQRVTAAFPFLEPPLPADYGPDGWTRVEDLNVAHGAIARLRIAVSPEGRVQVLMRNGDPVLAAACAVALEQGPSWTPARGRDGREAGFQGVFTCPRQASRNPRVRVYTKWVGASGALPAAKVAELAADRVEDLVACFRQAPLPELSGKQRFAFRITPEGRVGAFEWLEPELGIDERATCVLAMLASWRFPSAASGTTADVELYVTARSESPRDGARRVPAPSPYASFEPRSLEQPNRPFVAFAE